ncbi:hypothetical protein ACA910_004638 [Epithemia clementina (nom. ined.)]
MLLSQGKGTTNQEYLLQFTNVVEILDHCGARLDRNDGVIDKILADTAADPDNPTDAERTVAEVEARDWYLAFAFLAGATAQDTDAYWRTWRMISYKDRTGIPKRSHQHTIC